METEQLHTNGRPLCPTTNYENDNAAQRLGAAETLLDEIAERVATRLLEKTDIAEWAKQAAKPAYTAAETGADPSGSAQRALQDAKEYSDGAYRQATGYTDTAIARLIGSAPTTLDTLEEIARAMSEHDNVVQALEAAVGLKASETEFQSHAGNKTVHVTASERTGWNNAKTDAARACQRLNGLDAEVDGIKTNFQDGCNTIAGKLTACGVSTPAEASPGTMASNIQKIYDSRYSAGASAARVGNATAAQVLTGRTFTSAAGSGQTGTMINRGAVSQALNCGGSYTIPAGYHSGTGKVTANTLASQTPATAAAGNITKGKTAYVNGVKVTGTGADNTANYNNGYNAGMAAGKKASSADFTVSGRCTIPQAAGMAGGFLDGGSASFTCRIIVENGTPRIASSSFTATATAKNYYTPQQAVTGNGTGTVSIA